MHVPRHGGFVLIGMAFWLSGCGAGGAHPAPGNPAPPPPADNHDTESPPSSLPAHGSLDDDDDARRDVRVGSPPPVRHPRDDDDDDDARRGQYSDYPAFDWPPPKPSALYNLPQTLFRPATTLGDMNAQLQTALAAAGYSRCAYFSVPGGFALATQLEQIDEDGTPKAESERWTTDLGPLRRFSLRAYVRALGHGRTGYFRVMVFLITDRAFSASSTRASRGTALEWLEEGANRLHPAISRKPYSANHAVTAYAFEFEKREGRDPHLRSPGRLTGQKHLEKAGVLRNLRGNPHAKGANHGQ